MDTDSFMIQIKTDDFYQDMAKDVAKRFDTLNYEVERTLEINKNKNVFGVMKNELGGEIKKECFGFRPKKYSYLTGHDKEEKKGKGYKCNIKCRLKFTDYKNCLQIEWVVNCLQEQNFDVEESKRI